MSKGSKQRPGTGYADNWDRIFGKKEESAAKPTECATGCPPLQICDFCQGPGGPDNTRITGNFRCKINGLDTGAEVTGFEFLPQPGFNYLLEAIEPPAKTCQGCRHWSEANQPVGFGSCDNPGIASFHEQGESRVWLTPPADFGCNLWGAKV